MKANRESALKRACAAFARSLAFIIAGTCEGKVNIWVLRVRGKPGTRGKRNRSDCVTVRRGGRVTVARKEKVDWPKTAAGVDRVLPEVLGTVGAAGVFIVHGA